jgi:hypothetical protein
VQDKGAIRRGGSAEITELIGSLSPRYAKLNMRLPSSVRLEEAGVGPDDEPYLGLIADREGQTSERDESHTDVRVCDSRLDDHSSSGMIV